MASGFETYEEGVQNFYLWQYGGEFAQNSFPIFLIEAYRRADSENKTKMMRAWPYLKLVYDTWDEAQDNGNALFRKHGHQIPGEE